MPPCFLSFYFLHVHVLLSPLAKNSHRSNPCPYPVRDASFLYSFSSHVMVKSKHGLEFKHSFGQSCCFYSLGRRAGSARICYTHFFALTSRLVLLTYFVQHAIVSMTNVFMYVFRADTMPRACVLPQHIVLCRLLRRANGAV